MENESTGQTRGVLYMVGTPIGNLGDITLRALETLRTVDLILAEDTRQSRRLLNHFEIAKPMLSYHEHNEEERVPELLAKLQAGAKLALITDAGTPAVSDPGYRLAKAVSNAGLAVVPIPGANAAITAISASGLASNNFIFLGFAPKKDKARNDFLTRHKDFRGTLIFYESPHRVANLLASLTEVFGQCPTVLARELTKMHEEFLRGSVNDVLAQVNAKGALKGECVVLLDNSATHEIELDPEDLPDEIMTALQKEDVSASDLAKNLAKKYRLPKNDVYQQVLKVKNAQ